LIDWWGMIPASNLSSTVLIWFKNHRQFTLFLTEGEIGRHVGDNHANYSFVFCRAYGWWRIVSVRMQHSLIFEETWFRTEYTSLLASSSNIVTYN
jgi:hypothetical protein